MWSFPWRVNTEEHDEVFEDLKRENAYKFCPHCGMMMMTEPTEYMCESKYKNKYVVAEEECRVENHENIESCVKVLDSANWLLERELDIEKREKLFSIALEATKVLRKLNNIP